MNAYRALIRPLLFRLSADRAHALAHQALRWELPWRVLEPALQVTDPRLRVAVAGIPLENPVGLAAGFDKNGDVAHSLVRLGFGYVVIGSIMPHPRAGNPLPRVVRYPESRSVADSSGLPSKGRAYALERLGRLRGSRVPVVANVGGLSAQDLAEGLLAVEPYVSAVEVSLACPNVSSDHPIDELATLRELSAQVAGRRSKPVSIVVPLPVKYDQGRLAELIECCCAAGFEMLKINGGRWVDEPRLGTRRGTLHGGATFQDALGYVEQAARLAQGRLAIKANGGIFSGQDAFQMFQAGATTVEVLSAFVYEGWAVARKINRELLEVLDARGLGSLAEAAPALAGPG
ncbi:MAG: hypothetical protein HY690_02150 [Chloroflexi bacterium]|nr:hypothetical protein [Chloroflexota bacterium]